MNSRLLDQSPPARTGSIQFSGTREGGFCSDSCGFNRQAQKICLSFPASSWGCLPM
ncbi:hypothetical protein H6G89_15915 [Oscillatoria sp. FACHB-1407]|uniref:hypothetical protein n=1 Tax=Oscillatoria sp. FACHB-1407 TaxID=2692847 RepID=UPI0016834AA0|nr:hypothetical protein [Oscillatoria sp. FACHB-1407]MBD2462532.1 hypothetical protein [Oscillatoria sp. FACHB-1407]